VSSDLLYKRKELIILRMLPFFKPKKGFQLAGSGGGGGGGSIDTSALANKTDLTAIILTGTTNTSGGTITAGTWFYLNSKLVKAKVDIASNATFTKDTNYEEKTFGEELTELNSKFGMGTLGCEYQPTNHSVPSGTLLAEWLSMGKYTFIFSEDSSKFTDLPTSGFAGSIYDIFAVITYHTQLAIDINGRSPAIYVRDLVGTNAFAWKQLQYTT
jgi:hypothetical protein